MINSKVKASQRVNYPDIIQNSNKILLALKCELEQTGISNFSSEIGNESPSHVFDSLVKHRMVKKFSSGADDRRRLRKVAFDEYIRYDQEECPEQINLLTHYFWRKVRLRMGEILKRFHLDLNEAFVEFSPGETFVSTGGDTSVLGKLDNQKHWTTTVNCLELTLDLIWSNASLKRMARHYIASRTTNHYRKGLWLAFAGTSISERPRKIFDYLVSEYVLTIVSGARLSSVEKNTDTDRTINVECLFPVLLQRMVAGSILKCLSRHGNDLGDQHFGSAQHLHGFLLKTQKYSTIDFSNASNSVWRWVVAQLYPIKVQLLLDRLRSHYVTVDGNLYEPNMLSSMGNGFTFEVMTCLLYAIGRELTYNVRVFGDDVVIDHLSAEPFIRRCNEIGFRVNYTKTFINTKFRESCGYFYHDDFGYFTSFDFTRVKTYQDYITTCNKLTLTVKYAPEGSKIVDILRVYLAQLTKIGPTSSKGPIPETRTNQFKNLAAYVFDEKGFRKHLSHSACRAERVYHVERLQEYFKMIQQDPNDYILVYVPFFVPKQYRRSSLRAAYLASLYVGSKSKRTIRGKGVWLNLPALLHRDGTLTLARDCHRIRRTQQYYDTLDVSLRPFMMLSG